MRDEIKGNLINKIKGNLDEQAEGRVKKWPMRKERFSQRYAPDFERTRCQGMDFYPYL